MSEPKKNRRLKRQMKIDSNLRLASLWKLMYEDDLMQEDVAGLLSITRCNLNKKLRADDLQLSELDKIAECTGRKLVVTFVPQDLKKELELKLQEVKEMLSEIEIISKNTNNVCERKKEKDTGI